jgi:hypothetical protein
VSSKPGAGQTAQQNRALHLYYEHLAKELNAAGYTVQLVLKEKIDLDWQPSMVKELLWRTAQTALLGPVDKGWEP